jgi:hypothetical protein
MKHAGAPVDAGAEPLLIDRSDGDGDETDDGAAPGERRGRADRRLVLHQEIYAGKPKREADPLPRHDPLAEQPIGDRRSEQRLESDHERRERRRQAVRNRDIHPTEIKRVHQHAGHVAVEHALAAWPPGPGDEHEQAEQQYDPEHAQRQEGQRLGVRKPKLRPDEPRRPEHHEHAGCGEDRDVLKRARHFHRPGVRWVGRAVRGCGDFSV